MPAPSPPPLTPCIPPPRPACLLLRISFPPRFSGLSRRRPRQCFIPYTRAYTLRSRLVAASRQGCVSRPPPVLVSPYLFRVTMESESPSRCRHRRRLSSHRTSRIRIHTCTVPSSRVAPLASVPFPASRSSMQPIISVSATICVPHPTCVSYAPRHTSLLCTSPAYLVEHHTTPHHTSLIV